MVVVLSAVRPASHRVVAVSGDLVGSRNLNNRKDLASMIERAMAAASQPRHADWLALPMLTRGLDEFSAALDSLLPLFDFSVALNEALWPLRFRIGVGVGGVDVGLETGIASRLDGPAFHLAAEALADARTTRRPLVIRDPSADPVLLAALEALAQAHGALVEGWTPAAARQVPLMRTVGHQVRLAEMLGVTQQAVSRTLTRARYRELRDIEGAANAIIAGRLIPDEGLLGES
jgi:hypothetical protein